MKRNFLLTLLLTLLPFVGWAADGFTFRLVANGADLANPYVVTSEDNVPSSVLIYWNGGVVSDGVWSKQNAETGEWTAIYDGINDSDPNLRDFGKITGVGLYKIDINGDGQKTGTLEIKLGDTHSETPATTSNELEVKPKTSCVMPYGLPFELKANDILVTPAVSDAVKAEILKKIKINQDLASYANLGHYEFTIGLINPQDYTVKDGEKTYIISPTGKGEIDIQKGTNTLWQNPETNEYAFTTATGLVFNGYDQSLITATYNFTSYNAEVDGNVWGTGSVNLVSVDKSGAKPVSGLKVLTNSNNASFVGRTFYVYADPSSIPTERVQLYTKETSGLTATGVWVKIEGQAWSTYGTVQFFRISEANYRKAYEDAAVREAQAASTTTLTPEEIAAIKQAVVLPNPSSYRFGTENPVLTETWLDEGVLPTGKDAGTYYVWAKAADGGLLYGAADGVWYGTTSIAQADPTGFAGTITGVDPYYYVYTSTGNWNKLYRKDTTKPAINPSGTFTVSVGEYSETVKAENIEYFVKFGTKQADGTIKYAWTNPNAPTPFTSLTEFPEGYYQLVARSKATDNIDLFLVGRSEVTANFEVKKPTVEIQTTMKGETSATYAFGVEPLASDYDWNVDKWNGYEGSLKPKAQIPVRYKWTTKVTDAETGEVSYTETTSRDYGTYYVFVEGTTENAFKAGDNFGTPVIKPAVVVITATNILAKVAPQELVFGQELPLKLTYSQGAYAPESQAIKDFEAIMWKKGFVAKNKATNEEIELFAEEDGNPRMTGTFPNIKWVQYYKTTILPVGEYEVTANVAFGDNYKVLVAKGDWTVTAKSIKNADFNNMSYDTPDPRVKGMGGSFSLNKTYTSKEIELGFRDLMSKFTYRANGRFTVVGNYAHEVDPQVGNVGNDEPFPAEIQAIIKLIQDGEEPTDEQWLTVYEYMLERYGAGIDPEGYYYGNLLLGRDFEITSYTNNINAGTATFHVKGIGNFKDEKDLNFTIDKAPIFVFPETKDGGNKWAVGSPMEDAFSVDWNGKNEIPELSYKGKTYKNVPTGIKYQLHAFVNDKDKDMTGEEGFQALKVKFIVGASVGEYAAGLEAYAENDEKAKNYEFVFQTAPLTIEQGTIVLAVADITATDNEAVTYSGTDRPREKTAAGKFTLAPANKQVQTLDPALVERDQWQLVATDKDEDGKPWAITWEDNLDEYRETVDASKEIYRYPASAALATDQAYTIECKAFPKNAMSSTNYKFVLAEGANVGALTVKQADATIAVVGTVANAEVPTVEKSYGDFIALAEGDTEHRSAEYFKNDFIAHIGDLNWDDGVALGFKYPYFEVTGEQTGDNELTDLYNGATVNAKSEIIITEPENLNYNFTLTNGILVIGASNEVLALTSEPVVYWTDKYGDYTDGKVTEGFPYGHDLPDGAEPVVKNGGDLAKIKTYDKVPVKAVTIKLKAATLDPENEAYSEWKAGQWHTMVLPFATTVGEIAYNFKYAIVNVVDVNATNAATKPNEVHFMLQEIMDEIPANTPFMIKSQYDFDYDNTLLYFGNVEGALAEKLGDTNPIYIEYDAKPSVEAGKTYTFEGTYDQMVIDKNTLSYKFIGPDNRWKQFSETSTSKYTLQPYAGYLNLQGLTGTREVVCFFEEEDGSTTAINAAELQNVKSAEGLYRVDGIKLQSAPTQKGVYIQNGKKFVK